MKNDKIEWFPVIAGISFTVTSMGLLVSLIGGGDKLFFFGISIPIIALVIDFCKAVKETD